MFVTVPVQARTILYAQKVWFIPIFPLLGVVCTRVIIKMRGILNFHFFCVHCTIV